MSERLKTILKSIGFFTLGFAVLYLVYRSQNQAYLSELIEKGESTIGKNLIDKIINDFGNVNYGILGIVVICFMVSNVSRAIRWQMLLDPVSHKPSFINALGSIMAAYLVNLGIPRSGEFVRAGILSKYENIPAEKVMGTIVTDRILDVISLIIMILLAFTFSFNNMYGYFSRNDAWVDRISALTSSIPLLLGGVLIVFMGITALFYYRQYFLSSRIGQKLLNIVSGFKEGLQSIFILKNKLAFLFHSILIWLMYFFMTYLSFFAFAATSAMSVSAGLVVFVFGTLGFVFPAPGGMGSYQFLVTEALNMYGISVGDASSFANIVFFTITIFCNVFFGILAFIILPIFNRQKYADVKNNNV